MSGGLAYRGPTGCYNETRGAVSSRSPQPGGAFSALAASMQPVLANERPGLCDQSEDPNSQPEYTWDEFGFRVEEEDGPEDSSNKLLSIPFVESPKRRLQWAVELELGGGGDIQTSGRLGRLVREGVPHSLRNQLWPRLLRVNQLREKYSASYQDILAQCDTRSTPTNVQIEKDLLRTLPTNICFSKSDSVGVARLRRVLRAVACHYPDIGYCQGMGMIAATLLLFCSEDDVFWMMAAVMEDLLPSSYFSSNLWGAQADQAVLGSLVTSLLPGLASVLASHNIELSLISLHWFLTLFSSALHIKILVRVWDLLFHEGSTVMFRMSLGMLKLAEDDVLKATNTADIFNILTALPSKVDDVDILLETANAVCGDEVTRQSVETLRRKHLSKIMSDISNYCLNVDSGHNVSLRPWNVRRKLNRSKSIVDILIGAQNEDEEGEARCKNVRRTEMFVFLRESILRIGTFFQGLDPVYQGASMQPDYSLESHDMDLEVFTTSCDTKRKRARALIDFERTEDDELGFCKSDVITILSQRDEHCWVGELHGHVGWFPAKFVDLIDERSKQYSSAGDDKVNQTITDLVRGPLASGIKQMLEQGLKSSSLLSGSLHPWQFIVDAANEVVEADYKSVFSRLVLCKTFKLEEDGKVLSPEELLYRCVHFINHTHDKAGAGMDVKLRSLVCLGLNEQVLHLWWECLCLAHSALEAWYLPHSLVSSPGWILVKCELRLLSQFAFHLSPDWELPGSESLESSVMRLGVRDMLVKHHLFSWNTS